MKSVYLFIYSICNSDLCLALSLLGLQGLPAHTLCVPCTLWTCAGALPALTPTHLTARLGGHALEAGG